MNVLLPFLWGFVDLRVDCKISHIGIEHDDGNTEVNVRIYDARIHGIEFDDA